MKKPTIITNLVTNLLVPIPHAIPMLLYLAEYCRQQQHHRQLVLVGQLSLLKLAGRNIAAVSPVTMINRFPKDLIMP